MAARSCKGGCCITSSVLLVITLPWLLATIFTWIYAEGLRRGMDRQDIDMGIAIMQSVSAFLYIGYIISALGCMFCVGDPKDTYVRFCLILGIAIFAIVPIAAGITLAVTAGVYATDSGIKGMGAFSAVLCTVSTSSCCAITIWALFCGSKGARNESRFPTPIAYAPLMWRKKEDERDFDNSSSTTDMKKKSEVLSKDNIDT